MILKSLNPTKSTPLRIDDSKREQSSQNSLKTLSLNSPKLNQGNRENVERTESLPKRPSLNKPITSPQPPKRVLEDTQEKPSKPSNMKAIKGFSVSKDPHLISQNTHNEVGKEEREDREKLRGGVEKVETVGRNTPKKQNREEKKQEINNAKPLTVTEFYCLHHDFIKEITENVLTKKYGTKISDAIDDLDTRMKIENESFGEIRDYIDMKQIQNIDYSLMTDYVKLVFAEAMGFGILEILLNDKEVDEIIVQEHDYIQAEIHGVLQDTPYKFPSFDVALGIVKRIIRPLNKTLDVSNPNVDGQLPDGSRISASIPPVRAEGQISMNIRKFSDKVEPLSFYAEKFKSSTPEMVEFINAIVGAKKTNVISGGTGSGKTTLLNSLSYAINKDERIIVIEDTREIRCQVPRVEYYLMVPANNEGYKGISISDIMQMAQRKRPDRIFVGECRGSELNEFLNAANTGHPGSMTSLHSNGPHDAFSRMENMLQKNPDTRNMTHEAMQRTLASSVDFIIQTQRLVDGKRRITHVTEVLGYGDEGFTKMKQMKLTKEGDVADPSRIYMKDVFYFKELNTHEVEDENGNVKLKVDGQFMATGYVPYCIRELKRKGYKFNNDFFKKRILLEV